MDDIRNIIGNIINKIAPRENMNSSTEQQWGHLDIGTSIFVTCIILYIICFNYLLPDSSNIKNIVLIIILCITFIFPLSWISSIVNYPSKNTKFYILIPVFIGIIFEFVTLFMTILTNNAAEKNVKNHNKNLSPEKIDNEDIAVVSPYIIKNNKNIYYLFTTTIVLIIGSILTYFYDEVTIEKEKISNGMNITPGSTMGTNIHWWLSFLYDKANMLDDWWHETMEMISIPAILKMFLLYVIGFLITFFIFVDLRFLRKPSVEQTTNEKDYVNGTSLPNTTSPLMQDGVYLLYGKDPVSKYVSNIYVRYIPNVFTQELYSNKNLYILLSLFLSLLICIFFIPILYFITNYLKIGFLLNISTFLIASIFTFLLCFLVLYYYFPEGSNMTLVYLLITFIFAFLSAPLLLMLLEIAILCFGYSISNTNMGWRLLCVFLLLTWGFTFGLNSNAFNINKLVNNIDTNSNLLQIFIVILISMAIGWFFGLSFHFDVFSFLFVLIFTPIKYIIKVIGPITILVLSIIQLVLAFDSVNRTGKTTAG